MPTIEGNVDYRDYRDQVLHMHQLLEDSRLEVQLLDADRRQWLDGHRHASAQAQQNRERHARRALRCNLVRRLLQENFLGLAARLADSPLLLVLEGNVEKDGKSWETAGKNPV